MTTLIIGCGYLGQRLGARLRQRGERVFGTVRSHERANQIASLGIEPVIAEVLVPASLKRLPAAERVFYGVGFDRAGGASMRMVYVDGLRHVLEAIPSSVRAPGVRKLDRRLRSDGGRVGRRNVASLSRARIGACLPRGRGSCLEVGRQERPCRLGDHLAIRGAVWAWSDRAQVDPRARRADSRRSTTSFLISSTSTTRPGRPWPRSRRARPSRFMW